MTRKTPTETGEKIINDTKIGLATDTARPTERPKADTTRTPQTRKQPAQEGTDNGMTQRDISRTTGSAQKTGDHGSAYVLLCRHTATGIRTPVSGMRSRRPSPLDDSGA